MIVALWFNFHKMHGVTSKVMLFGINNIWKPLVQANNVSPDVHRAQNTETVKSKFREIGTTLALIPGGCTSER